MAGSEAARAIALLGILLLIWFDGLSMLLLALLGLVAVCGTVAYSVAAPALVPSLVTPKLLPAANARIELARTVAFASGPALGGVLVGWVGAAPCLRFCRSPFRDRRGAAVGHFRAPARAGAAPASAAGNP